MISHATAIAQAFIASHDIGPPCSPYEAAMDALRAWDGRADPAYLTRLRAGLERAELSNIRGTSAAIDRLIGHDAEGRN